MSNPNLQKIIKLTQAQYNTLSNGGTVGDYTGLNDNYLYLIQDDAQYATEGYVNTAISTLDNNVVHKGTSSSSVAEDIYGSKHFLGATTLFSGQYGIMFGADVGYAVQTIKGYQLPNHGAATGLSIDTEALVLKKLSGSGAPDPIISDGKSGYGLNIPDTASWTANKTIATTDDVTQILRFI